MIYEIINNIFLANDWSEEYSDSDEQLSDTVNSSNCQDNLKDITSKYDECIAKKNANEIIFQKLRNQLQELKKNSKIYQTEEKQLKSKLDKLKKEGKDSKQNEASIKLLEKEIKIIEEKLAFVNSANKAIESQILELNSKITELENQKQSIKTLEEKQIALNFEKNNLQKELENSKNRKLKLEQEVNELEHKMQKFTNVEEKIKTIEKTILQFKTEIIDLEDKISTSQLFQKEIVIKIAELQVNLNNSQNQEQELQNQVENLKKQIKEAQNDSQEIANLEKKLLELNNIIAKLNDQISNSEFSQKEIANKIEKLQIELSNLQNEDQKFTSKIAILKNQLNELASKKQKLAKIQEKQILLIEKVENLQIKIKTLQENEETLKNKNAHHENSLLIGDKEITNLEKEIENFENHLKDVTDSKEKLANLEKQEIENNVTIEQITQDLLSIKNEIKLTSQQIDNYQNQLMNFNFEKQKLLDLENDKILLDKKFASLNDNLAASQMKGKELKNKNKNLENNQISLVVQEKKLKEQINSFQNEITKLEKQITNSEAKFNDENKGIICYPTIEKIKNSRDYNEIKNWIIKNIEIYVPESSKFSNGNANKKCQVNNIKELFQIIPSSLLLCHEKRNDLILKLYVELMMVDTRTVGPTRNNKMLSHSSVVGIGENQRDLKSAVGPNRFLKPKKAIKDFPNNLAINREIMLTKSNGQLYFDRIFKVIENYLKSYGLDCSVVKSHHYYETKMARDKALAYVGSLPFPKINSDAPNDIFYYYMQVSFDIKMNHSNHVFPIKGFTMLLSSGLGKYLPKNKQYF